MKTRILFSGIALFAFATCGLAQGESTAYDAVPVDTTSVPTLAQLKAEVLNKGVRPQGSIEVPSEHRALFCRFDDKLDKNKIPLRMRLGSVEEVNRMEAKPGFRAGQLPQ